MVHLHPHHGAISVLSWTYHNNLAKAEELEFDGFRAARVNWADSWEVWGSLRPPPLWKSIIYGDQNTKWTKASDQSSGFYKWTSPVVDYFFLPMLSFREPNIFKLNGKNFPFYDLLDFIHHSTLYWCFCSVQVHISVSDILIITENNDLELWIPVSSAEQKTT